MEKNDGKPRKVYRAGYNCFKQAVTLTFKRPTSYKQGMYTMAWFMSKQKTIRDFVFYPEYGENANFHFHGTVWYSNKVHFYSAINKWKRMIGFVKIKRISNPIGWHIYCIKDQYIIRHFYKRVTKYNNDGIMQRYHPITLNIGA